MNGRSRILILVKGLGIGGAERLISEAALYWDRQRFDYRVAYALPWKDQLVPELSDAGVPVHCIDRMRATSIPSPSGLRRLLADFRPHLVHAHLPTTGIISRLVRTCPVVYTEHNLPESYHPITRWGNRHTYSRNAAVIAVSEAVARAVVDYPGPPPVVIPNGVSCRIAPEEARAAREALGLGPRVPLVVHVGNLRPGKGHQVLIEATARLSQRIPDVVVVSIGGEKIPGDARRLEALVAERGLKNNFRWLGRQPHPLPWVAAADVYVNPADVEGLPVSLLEAMALSRPVVATAVGGVPDLIRHQETGIVVPPRAPQALADAVSNLLANRLLAERLGRAAQTEVENHYGLAAMVRKIEGVYEQLLTSAPAA